MMVHGESVEPWSESDARRWSTIAQAMFGNSCRHGRSKLEVENCGRCALTSGDEDGPNYAGWARLYVEARKAVPEKWRTAFARELASDNKAYATALRRSIASFGEPIWVASVPLAAS